MSAVAGRCFRQGASTVSGDGFIMLSSDAISLIAAEISPTRSLLFTAFTNPLVSRHSRGGHVCRVLDARFCH